jgi:hypothetical protein
MRHPSILALALRACAAVAAQRSGLLLGYRDARLVFGIWGTTSTAWADDTCQDISREVHFAGSSSSRIRC